MLRRRRAVARAKRDAADRLSRVHGAGELQAVLLALLMAPGSKRALRAWQRETAATPGADSLRRHAASLSGAARLPWFELLLARMAAQPLAARQELLQATRRVMGARGVARPIDRLHWLTMRRGLGEVGPLAARPESPVGGARVARVGRALRRCLHRVPVAHGSGPDGRQPRRPRLVRHRHGDLAAVRRDSRVAAAEGRDDGRGARQDADLVVAAAAGDRPQLGDDARSAAAGDCASATSRPMRCA